jgi:hypothetical protein
MSAAATMVATRRPPITMSATVPIDVPPPGELPASEPRSNGAVVCVEAVGVMVEDVVEAATAATSSYCTVEDEPMSGEGPA